MKGARNIQIGRRACFRGKAATPLRDLQLEAPTPASSRTILPRAKKRSSWIPWAELKLGVFGVDPLRCERCGGVMRVRAVVETMETARKLLEEVLAPAYELDLIQPARAGPACLW